MITLIRLLRPAKPWRDVAVHAGPSRYKTSNCCNVLRGCRLLKLKGAWLSAASPKLKRFKNDSLVSDDNGEGSPVARTAKLSCSRFVKVARETQGS
jgi:hypothetical protein